MAELEKAEKSEWYSNPQEREGVRLVCVLYALIHINALF